MARKPIESSTFYSRANKVRFVLHLVGESRGEGVLGTGTG